MSRYLRAAALYLIPIALMLGWVAEIILLPPLWFLAVGLTELFCILFWLFSRE